MSTPIIWTLVCAAVWTIGMLYFDWRKKKK